MNRLILSVVLSIGAAGLSAGEIPNTVEAVKNAKPGDYIVLVDGSHYILVEDEINIVKGEFDFDQAKAVRTFKREDGGTEFEITPAHRRIIWPDGKSMDVFRTTRAFDSYLRFLTGKYDPVPYTNYGQFLGNSFPADVPAEIQSFRGKVYHTFVTNGRDTFDFIEVREYNRSVTGEGLERAFQVKGGNIHTTLSGDGNLNEAGTKRDE